MKRMVHHTKQCISPSVYGDGRTGMHNEQRDTETRDAQGRRSMNAKVFERLQKHVQMPLLARA